MLRSSRFKTTKQLKNLEEIAKWQAEMYIYSCWLYAHDYEPVLEDCSYDALVRIVQYYWKHLTEDLRERIPQDSLADGSSIHLAAKGWREEDREGAFEWFRRVRGRDPLNLVDQ